jgi:hypothetical protein
MSALNYRPSRAVRIAAWATFVAFLAIGAWLGAERPDGFWWKLAHDVAQAISAVALALAGVGSILEWRARRRWTSAIQVIAFDLLNSLVRDTGGLMLRTGEILLGDPAAIRQLDMAFQLPWTDRSEERVKEWIGKSTQRTRALVDDPARTAEMLDLLQRNSEELRARSDRLRDAATALDAYVRGDHLMPLLSEIGWLHRRIHILCDYADNASGVQPAQVADGALKALNAGLAVAGAIGDPVRQIRSEVEDQRLRDELDENEWAIDTALAVSKYVEQAHEVENAREKTEDALGAFTSRLRQMQVKIAELGELSDRGKDSDR